MNPEARFKWHGVRPVDDGEMEETVRADMRLGGVDMRRPSRLIFSTVLLTADMNGPVVTVWGKKGGKKFHAEYSPKCGWVTLTASEGDAA
jgi:hypothetical protein